MLISSVPMTKRADTALGLSVVVTSACSQWENAWQDGQQVQMRALIILKDALQCRELIEAYLKALALMRELH